MAGNVGKSSLRGKGQLTQRERNSTEQSLNLDRNLSPKQCSKDLVTDGRNVIAAGTYDIPVGCTLTVSDGDELVVI